MIFPTFVIRGSSFILKSGSIRLVPGLERDLHSIRIRPHAPELVEMKRVQPYRRERVLA